MPEHPIITLDSQRAWECRWYSVRKDRILLPDGSEGEYNVLELPDAVWVVPFTTTGQIALAWHYRYPLQRWGWELPSGSLTPGESALHTAQRELLEEVGGVAAAWQHLMTVSTVKGIGSEQGYLYLAMGVELGPPHHEPAEVMSIHTFPAAEVIRMARAGEIHDGIGVLALLLSIPYLNL